MSVPNPGQKAMNAQLFREQQAIASAGAVTIDVRAMPGFTAIFAAGTPTYQPSDENGTVVTGSSSTNFTTATLVTPVWPYYLVTATGGAITLAVLA